MVDTAIGNVVTVPRAAIARWRAAMALMGLGLGTSASGLLWDLFVHEIAREPPESIYAAPHMFIFAGIGIAGLGFLTALARVRFQSTTAGT